MNKDVQQLDDFERYLLAEINDRLNRIRANNMDSARRTLVFPPRDAAQRPPPERVGEEGQRG